MTLNVSLMSNFDPKKKPQNNTVRLHWHGDDTMVRLVTNEPKVAVPHNTTIEVTQEMAKQLMFGSDQWTFFGEEMKDQPFRRAQKAAGAMLEQINQEKLDRMSKKPRATAAASESTSGDKVPASADLLTEDQIDAITNKKVMVKILKDRKIKANGEASLDELKDLLKTTLKEEKEAAEVARLEADKAASESTSGDENKDDDSTKA